MRIDFEQSGGLSAIRFGFHAELSELSPEVAEELRGLVAASALLERPLEPGGSGGGLTYSLRVMTAGRTVSWTGTDSTLPAELGGLIDRLSELAVREKLERS